MDENIDMGRNDLDELIERWVNAGFSQEDIRAVLTMDEELNAAIAEHFEDSPDDEICDACGKSLHNCNCQEQHV
jgi:hypothetical protein